MANDNSELQLKITLDDGSIVQGFLNVNKKASETGKKVESSFSKGFGAIKEGLDEVAPQAVGVGNRIASALSTPLGLVTASVVATGLALKSAFNLTLEGEKLNKLDKQFDSLAESFGVAGDSLKTRFIDSLGGLTDDSDAIQSLNKAFITLGNKVTQLPEIMEVARKATNLFGGDVTQNFEAINQAVATGSTRQLRSIGLIIDADKAYEKYAKSLGVTKDVLSESGKQQAILNEVLSKGQDRFKNAALETGGLTSAYQRFKITLNNLFEDIAKSFATSGGFLESFFNSLNLIVKKISGDPQQQLEDLQIKMNQTKERLFELQGALAKRQDASGFSAFLQPFKDGEGITANVINNINQTKKQLEGLNLQYEALSKKSQGLVSTGSAAAPGNAGNDSNSVDAELAFKARQKRESDLTQFLLSQDQVRLQNKIQQNSLLLNENASAQQKLALLEENFNIQDELREQQKSQQIASIKQKYRDENLTGSIYERQSLAAIQESYFQQELAAEQARNAQLKSVEEQANLDKITGFQSVAAGFSQITEGAINAADSFSKNSSAAFKQVGAQAFATLSQGVGRAFNNFGAALGRGEDAGAAFADAIGESLVQIASQFGDTFIQLGIGKLAASYGADATGYTLIAAGAALKIIAGFAGGAKSASGSPSSSDSGGGISSQPNYGGDLSPSTNLERQNPGTQISLTIQGDVFDSDQTSLRIASMLQESFDKSGVTIRNGAFA